MAGIKSFKDLDIWKKGMILVKKTYDATKTFPVEEMYGLTSQMRRSAVSVPSNIAEGFRRKGPREFRHFLSIVLGSLAELETQVIIARELGYASDDNGKAIQDLSDELSRMTLSLSHKL